jgi:hypothetical protein
MPRLGFESSPWSFTSNIQADRDSVQRLHQSAQTETAGAPLVMRKR